MKPGPSLMKHYLQFKDLRVEEYTYLFERARRGIGYLSQERSDFRRLTVWQNLQAILETLNITRHERSKRANVLMDQYGLLKVRDQRAETLSGGPTKTLRRQSSSQKLLFHHPC